MNSEQIKTNEELIDKIIEILQGMVLEELQENKEEQNEGWMKKGEDVVSILV